MKILSNIISTVPRVVLLYSLLLTSTTAFAQEKPASLLLKESFGSDPYNQLAYHDGTLVITGKLEAGSPRASRTLDILQHDE